MSDMLTEEQIRFYRAQEYLLKNTASLFGEEYIRALTTSLARLLDIKFAFVGHLQDTRQQVIQTYGLYAGGDTVEDFSYSLPGTPCEIVMDHSTVSFPVNVAASFPDDRLLVDMGIESYIGSPVIAPGGTVRGLIVVMHDQPLEDIDHIRTLLEFTAQRVGLELERYFFEKELAERLNRMTRFNHIVSHDLRSPVVNIIGLLDVLEQEPENLSNLLPMLQQSGDRMVSILHDLNEMLQLQEKARFPLQLVDVAETIKEVIEHYRHDVARTGGEIQVDLPSILIKSHPSLLRSIIQNILENAIKYREPSRPLQISIQGNLSGGWLFLEISDNGIGIDLKKYGDKVLEPFNQLDPSFAGNGLGLFMVESQLTQMNGHLKITSQPGEGTSVTCQIEAGKKGKDET